MFWKFSKLHEPLGECNLRTFTTSLVPVNHELYKKLVRFFIYSILNKILINQSEHVNRKLYISSVRFTSETSETLWSNIGNLQKTSVEPWTPSKFFGLILEIFGKLWTTLGNLRFNFVNLQKTSDHLWKSSEIFGRLRTTFGKLPFNFRNLRKTSDHLWKSSGQLLRRLEDFRSTPDIFGCLLVNFGCLWKTPRLFRKTSCLRVWRVQFGINWYCVEYNLGLIVLLSSNQNPVILLSVL